MVEGLVVPIRTKNEALSLRDRVYRNLRKSILMGKIPPGTRLVESKLAKEMAVSRTPIREALHKLELENLVCPIPKVGYLVTDWSEDDLEDLFATRTAIEQLAARWALGRMTQEELKRVEENLKEQDRVLRSGLTQRMIDLDTEFHEIICRASRSRRVYQMSQILRDHMLRHRMAWLHLADVARRARDGHLQIYKAIKSKDPRKLDEAVLSHMLETKTVILHYMKRSGEGLPEGKGLRARSGQARRGGGKPRKTP